MRHGSNNAAIRARSMAAKVSSNQLREGTVQFAGQRLLKRTRDQIRL